MATITMSTLFNTDTDMVTRGQNKTRREEIKLFPRNVHVNNTIWFLWKLKNLVNKLDNTVK